MVLARSLSATPCFTRNSLQGGVTAAVQDSNYDLTHADATKGRSNSLVPSAACRTCVTHALASAPPPFGLHDVPAIVCCETNQIPALCGYRLCCEADAHSFFHTGPCTWQPRRQAPQTPSPATRQAMIRCRKKKSKPHSMDGAVLPLCCGLGRTLRCNLAARCHRC